jgi:hypothetical protein
MCSGRGCAVDGSAITTYCFGHLLDVSLQATPAKLLTPSLTLPVAPDSGRHTLAAFNKGGWALAALFLLLSGCQATRLCMIALAGSGLVRAGREKQAPASIALSNSWACGGKDVDAGRRSTDIRSGNAMIGVTDLRCVRRWLQAAAHGFRGNAIGIFHPMRQIVMLACGTGRA